MISDKMMLIKLIQLHNNFHITGQVQKPPRCHGPNTLKSKRRIFYPTLTPISYCAGFQHVYSPPHNPCTKATYLIYTDSRIWNPSETSSNKTIRRVQTSVKANLVRIRTRDPNVDEFQNLVRTSCPKIRL